jgi:hypothetical protein
MITQIELAEAVAELTAEESAEPIDSFIVRDSHDYAIQFVRNLCGYHANPCADHSATRFPTIHEAGAACREARMTGPIRIEPAISNPESAIPSQQSS